MFYLEIVFNNVNWLSRIKMRNAIIILANWDEKCDYHIIIAIFFYVHIDVLKSHLWYWWVASNHFIFSSYCNQGLWLILIDKKGKSFTLLSAAIWMILLERRSHCLFVVSVVSSVDCVFNRACLLLKIISGKTYCFERELI